MKKILITGSTDGIGKLAAIKLAKEGHQLYLHGRNSSKLEAVIKEVKEASSNNLIAGYTADFSDLSAVRVMTEELKKELTVMDVLINNAGVFKTANPTTSQGYDIRFMVNYLAPYLLTNGLLPLLKKSSSPRIINLSSAAQAPVDLTSLNGKRALSDQVAYAQSKLALTMWSTYLANKEQDITIIPVNPGSLLNTKMVQEAYGKYWSSADKGGNILYDLAVSPVYEKETGNYFDNDKGDPKGMFSQAHPDAYNEALIAKLIAETDKIINKGLRINK